MSAKPSLFAELKRRNVLRAAVFYAGAVWALAQGLAQLGPAFGAPEWIVRWFLVAAAVGFPFWTAFAWFYELTPQGLKRESEITRDDSIARYTGRKLDKWIIGVLVVAVVLLLTNTLVWRKGAGLQAPPAQDASAAFAGIPEKSVAVLPLVNDSGDTGQQYFADGLSEDLIQALSQFAGLRVISRNSSFLFRGSTESSASIGAKLGVAHLLEGSVRRLGDEVRVTATLVKAADGTVLWSQHYDRPYADLFALQDAITQAVADALKAKLLDAPGVVVQSERPPSGNLAAWQAYQQGKFHFERRTQDEYRAAIDQFEKATRIDPRYAAAYAELSTAQTALASETLEGAEQERAYTYARASLDTALKLEPSLALAQGARGQLLMNADFDWRGAQAAFEQALKLAPNDGAAMFGLGTAYAALGKPSRAVDLTRKALTTDPLRARWYQWLSLYLGALGRLDEAERLVREAIVLQPKANAYHLRLTMIAVQRGDAKAALEAAREENAGGWQDTALAFALQSGSDKAAADAALKLMIDRHARSSAYQIAEIHALRRDPDGMFDWLERASAYRDAGLQYLLYDPFILRYRDDPRFAAFCKKLGLPASTDAKAMP